MSGFIIPCRGNEPKLGNDCWIAPNATVVTDCIHYLAFDLFVGTYIVQKGIDIKTPR
jgi:hypothetical protein